MKERIGKLANEIEKDLIKFTQDIIKIKSYTGNEKELALFVKDKMEKLGYDEVIVDNLGNVLGVIGAGEKSILFDSHIDTVEVTDSEKWEMNPFGGIIKDGKIYGRGSCDMKAGLAATIYAGYMSKKIGLGKNKKIYISASIMEEDYDGVALDYILKGDKIKPDYVVVCEPSELKLAIGHRGRALIKITTKGVSAHGSFPEKGENAVYKMNKIIKKVEELESNFEKIVGERGSVALSKIESNSVSLNAVPDLCSIYLDRRLIIGEDKNFIEEEVEKLIEGTDASWEIYNQIGKSWKEKEIKLYSFLPAWEIKEDHNFVKTAKNSYKELNEEKIKIFKWDFSTNGVTSAGKYNIPTLGFGPGNPQNAHKRDENCLIKEIVEACKFYSMLMLKFN